MTAETADTGWQDVPRKVVAPQPTQESYELGTDDVFFSTTDWRGVIEQANEVFTRIARYPREQMVGSPHNIIRHPVMPGAAFRAMWNYLLADQPFVAYVHNMAADGSMYTVLATVTPLDQGFLSVRTRPECGELLAAADAIYQKVRPMELQWESQGTGAPAAAQRGLTVLAGELSAAGFDDYTAFMQAVLPAEMQARIAAGARVPQRPDATGRLDEMAAHQAGLTAGLDDWVDMLDRFAELANQLGALSAELGQHSASDAALRATISEVKSREAGFSPIMAGLDLWSAMTEELSGLMQQVADEVEQLRASCAATRFRIALARLHCDQVGYFTVELIDQTPGWQLAAPGIVALCRALSQGVAETAGAVQATAELAAKVAGDINEMAQAVAIPRTLLASWQGMAAGRELSHDMRELMPQVHATIESTAAQIEQMGPIADECRRNAQPHDVSAIREHVAALSEAASAVAAGELEAAPQPRPTAQPQPQPMVQPQPQNDVAGQSSGPSPWQQNADRPAPWARPAADQPSGNTTRAQRSMPDEPNSQPTASGYNTASGYTTSSPQQTPTAWPTRSE